MALFRTVPELVRVNGKWTIEPFVPLASAFDWNKIRTKTGYLYAIETMGCVKIGMASNLAKRLKQYDPHLPYSPRVIATRNVPMAGLAYAEAWLHNQFREQHVRGEWFKISQEEALASMSKAVTRARAYAKRCAEWYIENLRDIYDDPAQRAKMTTEYQTFIERELLYAPPEIERFPHALPSS